MLSLLYLFRLLYQSNEDFSHQTVKISIIMVLFFKATVSKILKLLSRSLANYEFVLFFGNYYWKVQGGRSWQPFGERRNGHTNFCHAHICYFHDKCVVLHMIANLHICKLVQYKMQYIPCSIFLLSLDVVNIIEDQCRGPIMKEKDHLDG